MNKGDITKKMKLNSTEGQCRPRVLELYHQRGEGAGIVTLFLSVIG